MKANSICIVGGGSSGWMLATALIKHTNAKVTLIASPSIKTVGVGESTIPGVSDFIKNYLGFEEASWMPFCNASYKASIKFNDFKFKGHTAYHPFWTDEEYSEFSSYNWAIKNALDPKNSDILEYYYTMFNSCSMSRDLKFDKVPNFHYAYHMDADKFGEYCKEQCKTSVQYVQKNIVKVRTKETSIYEVELDDGSLITSDLYIDCSGFSSLLLSKALGEPFEEVSNQTLLNNKALTARVPYIESTKSIELEPYTDCTALTNGWAWNIPLWNRVGTGYVYSDTFINDEEAKIEFKEYLEARFGAARIKDLEIEGPINIKVGRYTRSWVNNCVAMGLSSGFLEPLESTGLALLVKQIKTLIKYIGNGNYSPLDMQMYNNISKRGFNEVLDFVSMHYSSTLRDDSKYWKYIQDSSIVPNSLTDSLYLQGSEEAFRTLQHFPKKSWEALTIGFGVHNPFTGSDTLTYKGALVSQASEEQKKAILKNVSEYVQMLRTYAERKSDIMPIHYKYLKDNIYDSSN